MHITPRTSIYTACFKKKKNNNKSNSRSCCVTAWWHTWRRSPFVKWNLKFLNGKTPVKWTSKFWNAKAHSNFVFLFCFFFLSKCQFCKFKVLTILWSLCLCSLILIVAQSKISYVYKNWKLSFLSKSSERKTHPKLDWWNYPLFALFFSLLFLTLLPSVCFYWHLATHHFRKQAVINHPQGNQ